MIPFVIDYWRVCPWIHIRTHALTQCMYIVQWALCIDEKSEWERARVQDAGKQTAIIRKIGRFKWIRCVFMNIFDGFWKVAPLKSGWTLWGLFGWFYCSIFFFCFATCAHSLFNLYPTNDDQLSPRSVDYWAKWIDIIVAVEIHIEVLCAFICLCVDDYTSYICFSKVMRFTCFVDNRCDSD